MSEELNRLNNNCEPVEELGPCKGVSLPTDCVIEDNLIGEFDGGTQHEFNEFILKELKEEIRRLEGLATIEGPAGEDGREIKLGSEIIDGDSWIVWRYEGEAAWKKLKKQSELKGTDGREVHLSVEVFNGEEWIVWNYVGENHTFPLINKEQLIGEKGIDGTDGREIELTVEDYFIKWRYVGTDTWEDLISIEALRGPRGLPGVPGIQGIPGEPGEQGEPGEPGREVEIDSKIYNGAEWIVWRYEGDPQWNPLIEKESLQGDDGQDGVSGREVELRSNGVYVQWRYNGELETDWRNLVPIFNLRGPAGDDGVDGVDGREIEIGKQLLNDEVWIVWRYVGDTEWIPLVKVSELRGEDGDEVELWTQDGWIVWKYEDEPADAWKRLIQISTLQGDPGEDGREVEFSTQIISGVEWISWRYVGESTWIPLIQLSALQGEPGRTPEMRFDGVSKIQWKYTDDTQWIDLYEFSTSVLDGVDFECLTTAPQSSLTDAEKFQLIIDRICSLQKVKRTGARNYIADTIYTEAVENISCPNGYEYNPDSGLCEHTVAGVGGIPEELVFVIDDSSSIDPEEKVDRNTFIRDILEELQYSIQAQNTSITFILYGIGATTLVERSYDIEGSMSILENTPNGIVGHSDYEFSAWGEIYKRKDEYVDTNAVLILVTDGRYYDLDTKISYFQTTAYEEYVNYDFLDLYKEAVDGEYKITATSLRNITNWLYTLFSNRVLVMLGENNDRLYSKKSYLNLNPHGISGTAWSDLGSLDYFPTEGDGLVGLKAYEAGFDDVSSIVSSVVGSIYDDTVSVPPTITGGTSLPATYFLGESTYLGIEWDGLMQGNVSKYTLSNPLALESTVVSMGLEERIEKDQDYAYSQFIKVDKPISELSVWLVGAEQHLLDSIKNPIPNKWYRFEGVRNLTETVDVEKEEARVVIKYKRNPDTAKEVVSIYRPTLVHGETIPDWLPSLKEMMGGHGGNDMYAFRDATNLTQDDIVKWRDALGIGEGVGGEHNELGGLQGGNTATDQFYHLTEEQFQQLSQLLYEEHTMNLTVTPTYGEKGVATNVTFNFTINPKQDQIISVTDNHSNSYNTTSDAVTIEDVVSTISRTFTVQYDKYGEILNKNYTKVYNAYVPQWRGRHTRAEMNSYLDLSTYLGKVVQASTTIENIVMPTNQYIWFASNKSDAKIYDQNEFQQTIGTWGDGVSEFYTKPLTITLQDGTTATTYLYRTRLTKTIPSTFKYTIR